MDVIGFIKMLVIIVWVDRLLMCLSSSGQSVLKPKNTWWYEINGINMIIVIVYRLITEYGVWCDTLTNICMLRCKALCIFALLHDIIINQYL